MPGVHNLADLVRRAADRGPDRTALIAGDVPGDVTTWGELDRRVTAAAGALRGLGLDEGDRVAIALPNVLDFPLAYFGALRAGLVALPVNPAYTAPELTHILGDSGTRALVAAPTVAGVVDAIRADLPALEHVVTAGTATDGGVGTAAFGAMLDGAPPVPPPATPAGRGGEDLAVLMYTSGTSGRPKGVMLSHRALLANLDQCGRISPPVLADDDVMLLALPLFHVYGLGPGLGMAAWTGCAGVLVERFDPAATLALMRRHAVTNVPAAPQMYLAWSREPGVAEAFRGVRRAVSGAAPLDPAVRSGLSAATGLPIVEGYGLTETAPVLTSTLMSPTLMSPTATSPAAADPGHKAGSVGRPVPGVELRLVDPAGGVDDEVEEDDAGEVVVRGDNLFSGYWPDGHDGPGPGGWWRTGDVAYADDDGDLFLVDRIIELVLVSGFNVYPREVEEVLLRHPDIVEAGVIGVPDPVTGEAVQAWVVPAAGVELSAEVVVEHCRRSLARFKCPTVVEVVDELPHSATGKVSKGRLRATARSGRA